MSKNAWAWTLGIGKTPSLGPGPARSLKSTIILINKNYFLEGKIKFKRPEEDDWFYILVLHQNRPPRSKLRSTKSHVSFKCIPDFFDVVIWGHEHECLIGFFKLINFYLF